MKILFTVFFLVVFSACSLLKPAKISAKFDNLLKGDSIKIEKKDFAGYATLKNGRVYLSANFKADSSKLEKLKFVFRLIE